jgi:hypothetical protein
MALTADQTNAMNAIRQSYDGNLSPVKDLEIVSNNLVTKWALSAADAKTFRFGAHPGHKSFGPDL